MLIVDIAAFLPPNPELSISNSSIYSTSRLSGHKCLATAGRGVYPTGPPETFVRRMHSLQIHRTHVRISGRPYMPRWFPNLQNVILCSGRQVPLGHWTPRQVADARGVPTMDEHELRRTIFRIIRCLLCANVRKVPNVHSSIGCRRRKVDGRVRRPCYLQHVVGVGLERVEFKGDFTNVPQCDCLRRQRSSALSTHVVGRPGQQQVWAAGCECHRVDFGRVTFHLRNRLARVFAPCVPTDCQWISTEIRLTASTCGHRLQIRTDSRSPGASRHPIVSGIQRLSLTPTTFE